MASSFPNKSGRAVQPADRATETEQPVSAQTTLQGPHICGRCESVLAPYRSVEDGRQCSCPEPSCPAPVIDSALCFFVKDPDGLEVLKRIDTAPLPESHDAVERMRLECGTTPVELIGERVEDARLVLHEAKKCAVRLGDKDLQARVVGLISEVDDFMAIVAERSQS